MRVFHGRKAVKRYGTYLVFEALTCSDVKPKNLLA